MSDDRDILTAKDAFARADLILRSLKERYDETFGSFLQLQDLYRENLNAMSSLYDKMHHNSIRFGVAATASYGCKDIGETIMDISETLKKLANNHQEFIKNCENQTNAVLIFKDNISTIRNQWYDQYKNNLSDTSKALVGLEKLRLSDSPKTNKEKFNKKILKKEKEIEDGKNKTFNTVHDILNHAFLEERRRYCEFVNMQVVSAKQVINYQEKNLSLLKEKVQIWEEVAHTAENLVPEAVSLIDNVCTNEKRFANKTDCFLGSPNVNKMVRRKTDFASPTKSLGISIPNNVKPNRSFSAVQASNFSPSPTRSESDCFFNDISRESFPKRTNSSPNMAFIAHYRALFDWIPDSQDSTKLKLVKGDLLRAVNVSDKGTWVYGCNSDGVYGWFPSNYVKKIAFVNHENGEPPRNIFVNNSANILPMTRFYSVSSLDSSSSESK